MSACPRGRRMRGGGRARRTSRFNIGVIRGMMYTTLASSSSFTRRRPPKPKPKPKKHRRVSFREVVRVHCSARPVQSASASISELMKPVASAGRPPHPRARPPLVPTLGSALSHAPKSTFYSCYDRRSRQSRCVLDRRSPAPTIATRFFSAARGVPFLPLIVRRGSRARGRRAPRRRRRPAPRRRSRRAMSSSVSARSFARSPLDRPRGVARRRFRASPLTAPWPRSLRRRTPIRLRRRPWRRVWPES